MSSPLRQYCVSQARKQQIERLGVDTIGWVWFASFGGLCRFLYDVGRLQAGNATRHEPGSSTRTLAQASTHIRLSHSPPYELTPIAPTSLLPVALKWWSMSSCYIFQSDYSHQARSGCGLYVTVTRKTSTCFVISQDLQHKETTKSHSH